MNRDRVLNFPLVLFFALSIVGLVMIPLLVMQPTLNSFQFVGQRVLIGFLFCIVCVFGVIAVFCPAKCRGMFQQASGQSSFGQNFPGEVRLEGHHPACRNFSGNRIVILGRVYCAACSGLLVGAVIAIVGAVAYFFVGLTFVWSNLSLVGLGEFFMFFGLFQIRFVGLVKTIVNAFFVFGSFLMLVGVDTIGKSLFVDLYVVGVVLFFLWFRISLSEWNNRRTCRECQSCFR